MAEIMVITFDNVNLVIVDSLMHVWWVIHSSQLLFHSFLECLKLAKIAMFHIVDPTKEVCGTMAWTFTCT
jgi:hypothetical protein